MMVVAIDLGSLIQAVRGYNLGRWGRVLYTYHHLRWSNERVQRLICIMVVGGQLHMRYCNTPKLGDVRGNQLLRLQTFYIQIHEKIDKIKLIMKF
jgi:hypothetical protein